MTVAPAATPVSTTTQSVAAAPIPFRKTATTSAPEVVGILVTTLVVLAAFTALAWWARRRGWLDRWVGQTAKDGADAKRRMTVLETLRISPKTTLYRIDNNGHELIVVESSAQVQISLARPEAETSA